MIHKTTYSFLIFLSIFLLGFVNHQKELFNDFTFTNIQGNIKNTSDINDKVILIHLWSNNNAQSIENLKSYKEAQEIYQKAFFNKHAKKGLVVISICIDAQKANASVINKELLPNSEYSFVENKGLKSELLQKQNLQTLSSNLIVDGEKNIIFRNFDVTTTKSKLGSMLTRDRNEINYYE
jgi:hypothetical protein